MARTYKVELQTGGEETVQADVFHVGDPFTTFSTSHGIVIAAIRTADIKRIDIEQIN